MNVEVISLLNESGIDQFSEYLVETKKRAKECHNDKVKFKFISRAIELMELINFERLPTKEHRFFETLEIEIEGVNYSHRFELLKPLQKEGIYELRLNMPEFNWRFRATFFPYEHYGVKYYCFIFPFEKNIGETDLTNYYRDRTFNIRYDLLQYPETFINLKQ